MRKIKSVLSALSVFVIYVFLILPDASAQENNFQIAPSPIPYPYFEDGRFDGTIGVSFVKISTGDMDLAGGAADFKGRMSFSEFLAIDGDLGITGMGGSMPGIPPMTVIYSSNGYTPYITQVSGDATLSYFSFRMAFDLELQPIKTDFGGLIIFAGPNITVSQFGITTPFNLIVPPGYSNTGEVYTGFTDTLTISSTLTGLQCGIQLDIDFGSDLRLSPFFMYSSFSGTQNMTDTTDVSGSGSTSISSDIPGSTSISIGMDIIIGEISIGTVLQQIQSAEETTEDTGVIMISVSYHFAGNDNNQAADTEEQKM